MTIKELYASLTDTELRMAVKEIKESESTGIYGEMVRNLTRRSAEITGIHGDYHISMINILKEAAYRWVYIDFINQECLPPLQKKAWELYCDEGFLGAVDYWYEISNEAKKFYLEKAKLLMEKK